jgi:DNA-binding transcriptional LysR family regulator
MSNLAVRLCRDAGFEPNVGCRFNNYLITLQHVANGGSIALLPRLAVDARFGLLVRSLAPPVHRNVAAAVRRSSASSASVNLVLAALRDVLVGAR